MEALASQVHSAIRAGGVPIDGVSIGVSSDRSTWRVWPQALQADAQPFINAFAEATPAQLADAEAERSVAEKALVASIAALWEAIPSPTMTKLQVRARAKAIYKTL